MNPCLTMKPRLEGLDPEIAFSLSLPSRSDAAPQNQECSRKQNGDLQEAYARERRIAESLQRVLLRTPPSEIMRGLFLEFFYEAALEEATVGGDSHDAFALEGNKTALVVMDASGKGLAAAERVAEIRFALRAFLQEHSDPGRALSCLNDFVCEAQRLGQRDDSAFATLTLVILNDSSGEMACLCAGGEPPLVIRANGTVEAIQICGSALGMFQTRALRRQWPILQ